MKSNCYKKKQRKALKKSMWKTTKRRKVKKGLKGYQNFTEEETEKKTSVLSGTKAEIIRN